jgi:2-oxo-3-hexenedioate decarboxylase
MTTTMAWSAAGETLLGVKLGLTSLGLTSKASQQTGWLTDGMLLEAGVPIPIEQLIHPRAEPEIVFVLGERLTGPGVTAAKAMSAVKSVYAGIEVIDSRYLDFKFTLPDVVASATGSVVQGHPAEALALAANSLAKRGIALESGWLVLTGGSPTRSSSNRVSRSSPSSPTPDPSPSRAAPKEPDEPA